MCDMMKLHIGRHSLPFVALDDPKTDPRHCRRGAEVAATVWWGRRCWGGQKMHCRRGADSPSISTPVRAAGAAVLSVWVFGVKPKKAAASSADASSADKKDVDNFMDIRLRRKNRPNNVQGSAILGSVQGSSIQGSDEASADEQADC